jgi:hypothetical protein
MRRVANLSCSKVALSALAGAVVTAVTLGSAQAPLASTAQDVTLVDRPFNCSNYPQPLNLGTVSVIISARATQPYDAIKLGGGDCTGTIQRIEVDTWVADGIKVGSGAHDLTIGGGYIYEHDHGPLAHQDGIQVMGGSNITFENLFIYAPTSNNAAIFISGDDPPPSSVVCDSCVIVPGNKAAQIGHSSSSGLRNSFVFWGKRQMDVSPDPNVAVGPVEVNNVYPGYCVTPRSPGDEGRYCPTANASVTPPAVPNGD